MCPPQIAVFQQLTKTENDSNLTFYAPPFFQLLHVDFVVVTSLRVFDPPTGVTKSVTILEEIAPFAPGDLDEPMH